MPKHKQNHRQRHCQELPSVGGEPARPVAQPLQAFTCSTNSVEPQDSDPVQRLYVGPECDKSQNFNREGRHCLSHIVGIKCRCTAIRRERVIKGFDSTPAGESAPGKRGPLEEVKDVAQRKWHWVVWLKSGRVGDQHERRHAAQHCHCAHVGMSRYKRIHASGDSGANAFWD